MYYLKAESEEALFEALDASGATIRVYDMEDPANVRPDDAPEDWQPTGEYDSLPVAGVDLDVIGSIFVPSGVMLTDEEGEQYPEMVAAEGYHANIRGITAEQAEQLPVIPRPTSPARMWAGD